MMVDKGEDTRTDDTSSGSGQGTSQKLKNDDGSSSTSGRTTQDQGGMHGHTNEKTRTSY